MRYLCESTELPVLSITSTKLLTQLSRRDTSLKELAEHLKLDPGLCARLLHVANSPFFGVCRKISALNEAMIVLGLNQTSALIQVEIIRSTLKRQSWGDFPFHVFWHRSLSIAASCQTLAERIGAIESTAFSLGLFHNFGILLLAQQDPTFYKKLLSTEVCPSQLAEEELHFFKVDHGVVGGEMLQSLNFPDEICESISNQYATLGPCNQYPLTDVLKLAHITHDVRDWTDFSSKCPDRLKEQFKISEEAHFEQVNQSIEQIRTKWFERVGEIAHE